MKIHIFTRFFVGSFVSLFLPVMLAGQNNSPQYKDSLRQVIDTAQGENKLRAYMHLSVAYYFESEDKLKMDTMLTIYSEMDKEARKQEDMKMRGIIRCNILKAFKNAGNYEEIFKRAPEYLDFLEKKQAWFHFYNIYIDVVDSYLSVYQFDRALAEAQKMYDKAQSFNHEDGMAQALYAMAKVYGKQDRWENRVALLHQAIELMNGQSKYYPILANAYFDLCQSLLSLKHYDELEPELKAFENINHLYEENVKREIPTTRANLWGCYARFYKEKNDLDKAEHYYNKIDSAIQVNVYKIMVYEGRAIIYHSHRQFDKALEEVNRLIELDEQTSQPSPGHLLLKARILSDMGNCKESITLANQSILLKDSLSKIEYARQADGLRTQYEVYKLEEQKARQKLIILFAEAGCVFLAIIVVIYIVYSDRLRRKNRSLYRQIQESMRNEKEVAKILEITPEKELSRELKLYRKLNALMENEKPFIAPALDRPALVQMLGTNEKYLANAVREGNGTTVATYISDCRLSYSLSLLSEQPDMPLDMIAENSGHGSYSAFFRAFMKKYGMSPSDYRKLSKSSYSIAQ